MTKYCANCGSPLSGRVCAICGVDSGQSRITTRSRILVLAALLIAAIGLAAGFLAWRHNGDVAQAQAVAATEVRTCMRMHSLSTATQQVSNPSDTSGTGTIFASCHWPPRSWAGQDGYSEIVVRTISDSERSEASGSNDADFIKSSCRVLKVVYDFGDQGAYSFNSPIYPRNGTVWFDGHQVSGARARSLLAPFPYPWRDEVVYLRNDDLGLYSVGCVS